ncbi:glutamyl-tRNA synthetase [Hyphopichia burtonii NRRL Y-1933]|uniref:Glutamate--tRNA ligase, mitochondrial n=1 Tax=Hyphopichia burtonii NRRL Y-1933 TaxID=984485 RepID=A0A1E4RGE0_9ASCO|nr:glutamyl-tRNA synthetase [Hyphopichia burtonii NRRL Y-1933]ODV66329.1 glutamyl-tRNA synthetase [Hyphopichia burtonii NRRL Y-1933]
MLKPGQSGGSWIRFYSTKKFSLKGKLKTSPKNKSIQPTTPARTRFAPSPTGHLHLGSLRTALYNYLLAKSTGGQFLLRLEDTDQKRLVADAEQNIYDSLKWCGLKIDEGPNEGGPYAPYRQSERMNIYKKYVDQLVESGKAYYCNCSKERLLDLRESATKLKPPTTVTYDRKCFHDNHHSDHNAEQIVRFKSPDTYSSFTDLMHGEKNLQPQYNLQDRRYDDFVIMKSDGLPTYHFANVIDDHLMGITHVIRGEEWLSSTPKHIALYEAFGWKPPSYVHIPLLTSLEDKKLSKRQGDIGILSMKEKGILPEAVTNFCALFGWSPTRIVPGVSSSEVMTLHDLIDKFSLDTLTKGNAKVKDDKLLFFNKHHLRNRINEPDSLDELVDSYFPRFNEFTNGKYNKEYLKKLLISLSQSLSTIHDIENIHSYIFKDVEHSKIDESQIPSQAKEVLTILKDLDHSDFNSCIDEITKALPDTKKKDIFHSIRFALSGGISGVTIPLLIELIGEVEYKKRLQNALNIL